MILSGDRECLEEPTRERKEASTLDGSVWFRPSHHYERQKRGPDQRLGRPRVYGRLPDVVRRQGPPPKDDEDEGHQALTVPSTPTQGPGPARCV